MSVFFHKMHTELANAHYMESIRQYQYSLSQHYFHLVMHASMYLHEGINHDNVSITAGNSTELMNTSIRTLNVEDSSLSQGYAVDCPWLSHDV